MCRTAFLQLLGIGRGRLSRTKRTFRGEDARRYGAWVIKDYVQYQFYATIIKTKFRSWFPVTQGAGAGAGQVSASVLQFLQHTYWSIAETLPHESLGFHMLTISPFTLWDLWWWFFNVCLWWFIYYTLFLYGGLYILYSNCYQHDTIVSLLCSLPCVKGWKWTTQTSQLKMGVQL